jgi:hypothetical protein
MNIHVFLTEERIMSASESRRRKRKAKRERNKDEIRCCIDSFADVIIKPKNKMYFPERDLMPMTERWYNHATDRNITI